MLSLPTSRSKSSEWSKWSSNKASQDCCEWPTGWVGIVLSFRIQYLEACRWIFLKASITYDFTSRCSQMIVMSMDRMSMNWNCFWGECRSKHRRVVEHDLRIHNNKGSSLGHTGSFNGYWIDWSLLNSVNLELSSHWSLLVVRLSRERIVDQRQEDAAGIAWCRVPNGVNEEQLQAKAIITDRWMLDVWWYCQANKRLSPNG